MSQTPPPPPGYIPAVPPAIPPVPTPPSSDERMWAMFGHLSALSGLLTGGIGYVVGPLIRQIKANDGRPFRYPLPLRFIS